MKWGTAGAGDGQFNNLEGITVDSLNNIYVTGYTRPILGGNSDVILLKYDLNGNLIFTKTFGGAKDDSGYGIDVSTDGIYITGRTQSFTNSVASGLLLKYDFIFLQQNTPASNLLL